MEGTRRAASDESAAHIDLAAMPSAPFWARRHVQATLRQWEMSQDAVETAELLASELVTNAERFAADPGGVSTYPSPANGAYISLTIRHIPGLLVIEVSDQNMNVPEVREPDFDSEGGRGLMLVQALSKEWGHYPSPSGGKVVYCVLAVA